MKIKVGEYHPCWMAHKCTTDTDDIILIDIMIDGFIPRGVDPEHLVGMEFYVEWTHPFISIAHGVK